MQVKESIPELRKSDGRVIFVSSGAAVVGYKGWGAYGASKAAMNHLSMTIAVEEPNITSIAIRPGVIGWSQFFRGNRDAILIKMEWQTHKCSGRSARNTHWLWEITTESL